MPDLLTELITLEAELHHAGRLCPRERLEQLLHPDFFEVGRSGLPYSRTVVLAYLASLTGVAPAQSHSHRLDRLGPDTALLTYRSERLTPGGPPAEAALRSSVWRRGAAGWQLFYHQGTAAAS
jgi:hypothetical protein